MKDLPVISFKAAISELKNGDCFASLAMTTFNQPAGPLFLPVLHWGDAVVSPLHMTTDDA